MTALYGDRTGYLERAHQAADQLSAEGFLLPEDVPSVMARAGALWDRVMAGAGGGG